MTERVDRHIGARVASMVQHSTLASQVSKEFHCEIILHYAIYYNRQMKRYGRGGIFTIFIFRPTNRQ